VIPTGDLERIELDRAEPLEDPLDPVATGRHGPRRSEKVAQSENRRAVAGVSVRGEGIARWYVA
jgi:hypothetical protein